MNSSSMFVLCVLLLSLSSATHADTIWESCDGMGISFKLFTLFPNPVTVGQIVDGNAVISLQNNVNPGDIKSGTISVQITYNKGYTFTLTNIPLCNSTNAINCNTLSHGDNTISFSYRVPKIPAGTYSIKITAVVNGASVPQSSCLTFQLTVIDPTQNGLFHSFIEAHLRGQAQFENSNYLSRGLGDIVQVGPVGPVPSVYSKLFEWGTLMSVTGSEDVISSYFNPTNFVWGMNGTMVTMRYLNSTRQQTYNGDFTIGYVSDLSKKTMDLELIDGTFNLTWSYTTDPSGKVSSTLAGTLTFSDVVSLPSGWSYPITLGRFGELDAETNDLGILVVTASTDYCNDPTACSVPRANAVTPPTNNNKKSTTPLSARNLALIIGLGVGGFLILILIIAIIIWRRYRQRNKEEDGIFSAARKPEYGNALVVDDIIQETRERGGDPALIPRLAKRPEDDSESDYSSEEEPSRRGGRGRERSPSPDSRSASLDSEDDEPSRPAPPPRYKSKSRSRSPDSHSDEHSDYSRSDAGSSASRSDDEDDR